MTLSSVCPRKPLIPLGIAQACLTRRSLFLTSSPRFLGVKKPTEVGLGESGFPPRFRLLRQD